MKIYNKKDFLNLKSGAIFAFLNDETIDFDSLCIKGESLHESNDFIYCDLLEIESRSSEERWDRLEEMRDKGASYPINMDFGRDGFFDKKAFYMVFERADIIKLIGILNDSLEI